MPDFTPRLSLYLPGGGADGTITPDETADVDKLNGNFRALDSSVGSSIVTSTTRPASPFQGQLIYETDTGLTMMRQGSQWIPVGGNTGYRFVQRVVFTSTGTFNKASYPWLRAIHARVQGAGGGGGGGDGTGTNGRPGGGGGGYAESFITDIAGLAFSLTATVGTGGAGGASTGAVTTAGGNGGNSSFSSIVVATGGTGANTGADGGTGGAGTVGDLLVGGSGGGPGGSTASNFTGPGGGSVLGGGGNGSGPFPGAGNGPAGRAYGGGGGGARLQTGGGAAAGGAGAQGIVILELFA